MCWSSPRVFFFSLSDVDAMVKSFIEKFPDDAGRNMFQCVQCGKTSRISSNIKANHFAIGQREVMDMGAFFFLFFFLSSGKFKILHF